MSDDKIDLKGVTLEGFERELQRGGSVFAAEVPLANGGGYAFAFVSKTGEKTYLALSREALDAMSGLIDILTQPQTKSLKLLVKYLDESVEREGTWKVSHPEPDTPSAGSET